MDRSSRRSRFIAGVLLTNSVPHLATGIAGRRQITPFGRDSSALLNLLWAAINVVAGALLLRRAVVRAGVASEEHWLIPLEAGCLFWGAWMTGFESLGIWLRIET